VLDFRAMLFSQESFEPLFQSGPKTFRRFRIPQRLAASLDLLFACECVACHQVS